MDVNTRNYRWSESRSKVCQMCDVGEDETQSEMNEVIERTRREWMVLLLGLCGETSTKMIDAVKITYIHVSSSSIKLSNHVIIFPSYYLHPSIIKKKDRPLEIDFFILFYFILFFIYFFKGDRWM